MNLYFAFLDQNTQVHVFSKTGNLRKWAVCINNEALSPMVIILPNNFLEFCVEKMSIVEQISTSSPASSWELAFGARQGVKRASVVHGLTCLGMSFYRFSISLVALNFCIYLWLLGNMMALNLCLNEVPAVSLWVIPRTAFMCVYLLSSPLWNRFTLTSGVMWNEPGNVNLNCPFPYLFDRFCVFRPCLWQCIVCMEGLSVLLLFSVPLPQYAHHFYPPISSTPESNTSSCWVTRMCQSLPWLMEELCPSSLLQSLYILHGPFPSSHNPCYILPMQDSVCPGVFFCYGERVVWCPDHYSYDRDSC